MLIPGVDPWKGGIRARRLSRLIWSEIRTQYWTLWILLPLPLIWFSGTLMPRLHADPYPFVMALTALMILLGYNHRQLERKAGRIADGLPPAGHRAGHEALLAKYAMVFVWFILSAAVCNAAGAAYMMYRGAEIRLSGPDELASALSVLLLAAGVCYPLHHWLRGKFVHVWAALSGALIVAGPSMVRSVPDALLRSPFLLLSVSAAAFALSYWPTYLVIRRTSNA